MLQSIAVSQIMTVTNNAVIHLKQNSVMSVNGGLDLKSGASIVHDNAGISNLYISGKFNYLGTYTQNTYGILRFFGSLQDTISGNSLTIPRLWIIKSGSGSLLTLANGTNLIIQQALRLVSNHILNIDASDLTLEAGSMIYADSITTDNLDPLTDPFSINKHISSNGKVLASGKIIRKFNPINGLTSEKRYRYPIGTVNDTSNPTARYYSPVRYVFNEDNQTIFGANSWLSIKCIASEHPHTEVKEVSLRKYWKSEFNSIIVKNGGYNIRFYYNQAEVQGFEEAYLLSLFYRPSDATYYINPGAGYGVEPINNRFYVDEINKKEVSGNLQLDGEWTAGQEEAISTFYYSRTNGNWNDPNTWSKQGYNGVAANTYPKTENDKAFIGNGRTVTVTATTDEIDRTIIDSTGRLLFTNPNVQLLGDSLYLKANGTLAISSPEGFHTGGVYGHIQTSKIRSYSTNGIFEFIGNQDQVTGPGIPDIVNSIIINKSSASNVVSLSKSILIRDSLVINEGKYHLFQNGNFISNGETGDITNRVITMRGGELIVQSYPTKYKNGVFNAGTITFDGTGSFRVPSSVAPSIGEPAVEQYHNLKFTGARGENTFITLDPTDTIRISGQLDISGLTFAANPISERFDVSGSKVVFNGNGNQVIPTGYATPKGINYRLKFHDLFIDGTGEKSFSAPNDAVAADNHILIRSFINIRKGTLKSNNHRIKVLGNWKSDPGTTFEAGSGLVIFEADGKVTNITSNGTSFNDLRIMGTLANGYVNYLDSLNIKGNLEINPNSLRALNSAPLSIQGNWLNNGVFVANTGRVYFNGTTGNQSIMHDGSGKFYNLTVNKSSGMVNIDGDSLIKVTNNLELKSGNIGGRNSNDVTNKPIVVDGTITRPGVTPGHVDGRLRLPSVSGTHTRIFPVGIGNDYNPVKLDIEGPGGIPGYLDAYVVLQSEVPSINNTILATQTPNGPELNSSKNIQKSWILRADTSGSQLFELSPSRTMDLEFTFLNTDLRGGANPLVFEIGQRTGDVNNGNWTKPFLAARNINSTKLSGSQNFANNVLHYFFLGDPQIFTYYSIDNGNFNNQNIWSTAGYESSEPATRAPLQNDNIRIGNGKIVTLNQNDTVAASRTFIVETGGTGYQNGHLIFNSGSEIISGAGTFRLDSGAAVTIKHEDGIATNNSGCVRTTTRQYNGTSNHNSAHFIYAGTGAQATGNGLPASMQTLKVDKPSGTLTFTGSTPVIRQVWDSLHFASGTANLSNVIMKVGGNFVIDNGATFTPGTRYISNRGNYGANNYADSVTWEGVVIFNGSGVQTIQGTYNDNTNPLPFNRFTISKKTGKLISKKNIRTNVLFFTYVNRANIDVATNNKYLQVFNPNSDEYWLGRADFYNTVSQGFFSSVLYGYIEGRLVRFVDADETGRAFPIGTKSKYAPVYLQRNSGGNSSGQTGGLLEIESVDGNHPLFSSTNIEENTNIQRYYEISRPIGLAPNYVQGNRPLDLQFFFTQDEPRGGINATNYRVFRLLSNNTWSSSANISTTINNANDLTARANSPSLGGNNIFTSVSVATGAPSITLMIGEAPVNNQRVFYARNSGNWNDPNTWNYSPTLFENTETGYNLNSNSVNDYPRRNNNTSRDYAIIGNGKVVNFNISDIQLRYVLLEKSANGTGELIMPGDSNFTTDQYVQKNGGKLHVGSTVGLTTTNTGNIRPTSGNSIINYDWNSLGNNNFVFIGVADAVQNTGAALPAVVGSITIDYNRTANNRYVDLTNNANLTIRDSLIFKNGRFRNRDNNRTITIQGDIVNYSNDVGFHAGTNPTNRAIILDSTKNQKIRGTSDLTAFPAELRINKPSDTVTFVRNATINSNLNVLSNTLLRIADGSTVIFGENGAIDSINVNQYFNSSRMFLVSGSNNTGQLRKIFATGNNTTREFTFPVGESVAGAKYGEARFQLNSMNFAAGNYLEMSLRKEYPHHLLLGSPDILSKYWSVNTSNITLSNGNVNTRFRYNDSEVKDNVNTYGPVLYRRADVEPLDPGWSATIFGATNLQVDTTNKFIIVDNAKTLPNHDWSAGDLSVFSQGKKYWSRQNGNWTDPNTWTNITNSGQHNAGNAVALNYPGFYPNDTVFIGSNHEVLYNRSIEQAVDSLGIGITSPSSTPKLSFVTAGSSHKGLSVNGSVMIGATGLLSKPNTPNVTSIDTLRIIRDFVNDGGASRGVDIHPNQNRNIRLLFFGNDSTLIRGEGNYTSIGNVRILKSDSIWNTVTKSASFSNAFSTSVTNNPTVDFDLDAGMYVHDVNANIKLSTDADGDVFLGDLVGLTVRKGEIFFDDGLICGQNASVWLVDGAMTIGNEKNDNFQYESVTIIDIAGTSRLKVAGSMRRRFVTSNVDFRIKDHAQIEVMIQGAQTNSSERRAAFDFGEANSLFKMEGNSLVKINKPMEKSLSNEKDPDYLVSSTNYVVTGGTVQFGDLAVNPVNPEPFNLISSVPFWNLNIQNTHSNNLFVGSPIVTVRNDMTIGDNSIFNQNGNNLYIGGDMYINGLYRSGDVGTRRVVFTGDTINLPKTKINQTLYIKNNNNEPFYDIVLSKPAGQLILSPSLGYPNSNLIVKNTLEFNIINKALITTGDTRYVQVGTNNTDLASIQRFGKGHVDGYLRRWFNNGVQDKIFHVGTSVYTPATILTTSGLGTEGLVSVKAFGVEHPDIANANDLQTNTHINRYWQIKSVDIPNILGDRKFRLTTQFVKGMTPTGDVKPGSSFGIFEHFRRTPNHPSPGSWFTTQPFSRTDSTTTTYDNTEFGDYVIGEISGLRFFSANNGDWNTLSTWVMGSYTGSPAARIPNEETDRVFIGNGKTVTIQNSSPRVRSVSVEEHNSLPGKLVILDERYLRGLSFSLNANCFLATDDAFGFTSVTGINPNIGAIRSTSIRSFGVGTYEYVGKQGQAIGDGPINPKTIIINNIGLISDKVTFSPINYTIEDTILVQLGKLEFGTGTVNLKGDFIVSNATSVIPSYSTLNINGTDNQYFVMNDSSALSIYNLKLTKPSGNLFLSGTADSSSLSILRNLRFDAANVAYINARTNNKKVILKYDTTTITRTGSGHIDGKLLRQTPGNVTSTFKYEIGYGSIYMPSTLLIETPTGTSGLIAGYVNSPPSINLSRIHPTKRINYYWGLTPWSNFSIGTGKANTTLTMPVSELANLTGGQPNNAILFRKSIPTENPNWIQRNPGQLSWNLGIASVTIANSNDFWQGLGEFYISEKYTPIYYSRQSGNWNDNNTWTLSSNHIGLACESGDFPNSPDIAFGDRAYIGLNHVVNLNISDPVIDTLVIRNNAKLDMGTYSINCVTCAPAKGLFSLQENATIAFGGTNIPSTTTTLKNFKTYLMDPITTTIEYTGNQTITGTPFHPFFIKYPGNLRFSGVDNKLVNVPVLVDGNVYVNENSSIEIDANSLRVIGNFYNSGNVFNKQIIEIGN